MSLCTAFSTARAVYGLQKGCSKFHHVPGDIWGTPRVNVFSFIKQPKTLLIVWILGLERFLVSAYFQQYIYCYPNNYSVDLFLNHKATQESQPCMM